MKHFGIFIAFPPTVDMRAQGLGRYLAMFLKGAEALPDVRFTIVCPSWSKEMLRELFESEQVPAHAFDLVSPDGKPYALRLYEIVKRYSAQRKRQGWLLRFTGLVKEVGSTWVKHLIRRAIQVHDVVSAAVFLPQLLLAFPIAMVSVPFLVVGFCFQWISLLARALVRRFWTSRLIEKRHLISQVFSSPQNQDWVVDLFDIMQSHEIGRMLRKINGLSKVKAWYCPTAFWPEFHNIEKPRLLCVPDVVLADFPVGFSQIGGDRFLGTINNVESAIAGGTHFATYSESIKWRTLVDRYSIAADNISVIPHAPNLLNQYIDVKGFSDSEMTSRRLASSLLRGALQRTKNSIYTSDFKNGEVKFLFYASQIRPNKNFLTLFRAYEYLLRKKFVGYKLFITGNPAQIPEVFNFINQNGLENDIISLHEISVPELAACYKLAALAVNPTLSEGGCPFTFTEALSVGTPVVMSRISVAEEVLTDPLLREITFFDPYDWKDCANRIEWAITHRADLLAVQRKTYAQLSQRSWTDVVKEHVRVLEEISAPISQGERG